MYQQEENVGVEWQGAIISPNMPEVVEERMWVVGLGEMEVEV
jgi:hypothetical protein